MPKYALLTITALALSTTSTMAQSVTEIDCSLEANASSPQCIGLPPVGDVQNFVPFIAPALAALGAAALAGGGSSGTSTSTTDTVSATN